MFLSYKSVEVLHIFWHIHHSLLRLVYLYISVYSTYLFPRGFCCSSLISLLRSCIYSGIYTTASSGLVYLYISVYSTYLFPRGFCCSSLISLLRSCIYSGIYTTASSVSSIAISAYDNKLFSSLTQSICQIKIEVITITMG